MSRLFKPLIQLLDASGAAASAGTLTFFAQGETTLQNTFQDAARTLANKNPVTVNGSGLSPPIYLQYLDYTVLAEDSDGGLLWQEDFDGRWLQDGSDYSQSATATARTVQSRLAESIFVTDYGAVGDNSTDDTAAIQKAIDAAGIAGEIIFSNGLSFKCDGSLTGGDFQTWRGLAYEKGVGTATARIRSTLTSGTFITTGTNPRFEDVHFKGTLVYNSTTGATSGSTATGMKLGNSPVFRDCALHSWNNCIETSTSSNYMRFYGGEFVRCSTLVNMFDANVFNMEFDGVIARFVNTITTSGDSTPRKVNNLKVMGGSFEQWTGALFNNIKSASFFGTYFENQITGTTAFGFNSNGQFDADVSLGLYGCWIQLKNLDRFVNYSSIAGGTFISVGNNIVSDTVGGDQEYFFPQDAGTGSTTMYGDFLDDRGTGTFQGKYTQNDGRLRGQTIVWPTGGAGNHAKRGQSWSGIAIQGTITVLADDASPSVAGVHLARTGGTTSITDFDDGVVGQTIKIKAEHSVTITDGAPIVLNGGANFDMTDTDTLTLTMYVDQIWTEDARSVN